MIVTAEHGGNDVPDAYKTLFAGHEALLNSHRGWDPGTRDLALRLARALDAPLEASRVTRLLVDLNRSPHNPRVFSEMTRPLPAPERARLLERFHRPYRDAVASRVAEAVGERRRVLHLSVHSFTPVWKGVARDIDLALLYDPSRPAELALCTAWARTLATALPRRVIRRNAPYRGRDDGLTTVLRRVHGPDAYLGIEIEVSQGHLRADGTFPPWVDAALVGTLPLALGERAEVGAP